MSANVEKIAKVTSPNFSCNVKRLNNKYGKNSKNNKFSKILDYEMEKGKESLEKAAIYED